MQESKEESLRLRDGEKNRRWAAKGSPQSQGRDKCLWGFVCGCMARAGARAAPVSPPGLAGVGSARVFSLSHVAHSQRTPQQQPLAAQWGAHLHPAWPGTVYQPLHPALLSLTSPFGFQLLNGALRFTPVAVGRLHGSHLGVLETAGAPTVGLGGEQAAMAPRGSLPSQLSIIIQLTAAGVNAQVVAPAGQPQGRLCLRRHLLGALCYRRLPGGRRTGKLQGAALRHKPAVRPRRAPNLSTWAGPGGGGSSPAGPCSPSRWLRRCRSCSPGGCAARWWTPGRRRTQTRCWRCRRPLRRASARGHGGRGGEGVGRRGVGVGCGGDTAEEAALTERRRPISAPGTNANTARATVNKNKITSPLPPAASAMLDTTTNVRKKNAGFFCSKGQLHTAP